MTEFDPIDDLIGKVLAKEATVAEQNQLNQWLEESEANRKYFAHFKLIFDKAAATPVKIKFDRDEAWQKVKGKMREEKRFQFFISPYVRVAAGIALITAMSYLVYQWTRPAVQTLAVTTDKKIKQDTLPDGSFAVLNKNSKLNFEYNSRSKTRNVKLMGEAYFEVKHQEEKPFVVEIEELLVRDIGTSFNIKAYPNSDTVVVTVESGEVQFYTLKDPGLILKAGEAGIYKKSFKEFSRMVKADTNVLAYKTKIFSFKDTDLKKAVEMINEIYDSKIILGNSSIGQCHVTVNFNNDKIEDIADIIAETLSLSVEKKGDEFILTGSGCNK
ncbi:MAG TPA: FecR domain-containing protein [Cyclobacteriaceae bacterium]|jgi:ferric-dicitrate binding protein FerR (iron transport regulator)|nr:FecR domain-containing protein [Cyclobacteriaceae bacterium]